jgi:hypothetical protein
MKTRSIATARPPAPRTIALEALATLMRNAELIVKTSRTLPLSSNRHGDLQVIRSASLHLVESADVLIAEEQGGAP